MANKPSRYHIARQNNGRGWMLLRLAALGTGFPATATVVESDLTEGLARDRLTSMRAAETALEDSHAAIQDYLVTVCSACRCASCWHGEFMCQQAKNAGTVDVLASVLRAENREHPDNFSIAKLQEVCGSVRYVA